MFTRFYPRRAHPRSLLSTSFAPITTKMSTRLKCCQCNEAPLFRSPTGTLLCEFHEGERSRIQEEVISPVASPDYSLSSPDYEPSSPAYEPDAYVYRPTASYCNVIPQ